MRKIIYMLAFTMLLASCGGGGKQVVKNKGLTFDTIEVKENIRLLPNSPDSVPSAKLDVKFVYPASFRSEEELTKLQKIFIDDFFGKGFEHVRSPREAVDKYVADYTENYRGLAKEFTERKQEKTENDYDYLNNMFSYSEERVNEVVLVNDSLVSYLFHCNEYTGGAHGINTHGNISIDLTTLKTLQEEDIFVTSYKDRLGMIIGEKLYAELKERCENDQEVLEQYAEKLENVAPNGNFLLDNTGIHYTYNVYEIFSYVFGAFDVEIPYNEIKDLLKPGVLERLFPTGEVKSDDKPSAKPISEDEFAYIDNTGFYFYNTSTNEKKRFVEEKDTIFNFAFDDSGNTLYYTVERDGSLWLKKTDLTAASVTPEWVGDWKLKKEDCITETYGQVSELKYNNNRLLVFHTFYWEMYGFKNFSVYYLATNKVVLYDENKKEEDYDIPSSFDKNEDDINEDFTTKNEQLYFKGVCLSDKMDLKALSQSPDHAIETGFYDKKLSPDHKKVLFSAAIEMGDLAHGPFCIAATDGSHQTILKNTDLGQDLYPKWLRNGTIIYADTQGNLFWTNIDNAKTKKITENVSQYNVR